MKQVEELKNRELIANFLGWQVVSSSPDYGLNRNWEVPNLFPALHSKNECTGYTSCRAQHFQFDTDWNWLMYLLDKIENSFSGKVVWSNIEENWCYITNEHYDSERIVRETKMQAVYDACLHFIKWYNTLN